MRRLTIGQTNTGKGIFAQESIRKGSVIKEMTGERMVWATVKKHINAGTMRVDDPLEIEEDVFLKLDPSSYFFNHSCEPNAGIRKQTELFALRAIKRGEEITFDYSTVVCTHSSWTMRCKCGSPSCRKIIGNVLTIPEEQLTYYIARGAFPDFVAQELDV